MQRTAELTKHTVQPSRNAAHPVRAVRPRTRTMHVPFSAVAGASLLAAVAIGAPERPSSPAADYATAMARTQARQAQDDSVVASGGRSIFMGHGERTPRVFVLLHGFTDSPKQFEALGQRLFSTGDNVYIPRLPHHAEARTRMRALTRITAGELEAFGDSTIDIARGLGDSIIVVGLSAGGNVAASIAQRRDDVHRVVLVAPAIAAGRVPDEVAHALVIAGSRLPNVTRSAAPDSERPDYIQGITTRGLAQVLRLGEEVRVEAERFPGGAHQIMFLLNENDRTVSSDAAIDLAKRWSAGPSLVSVYEFPGTLRLPHNVMETTVRGGNLEVVLPVVESMARGTLMPTTATYRFLFSDWGRTR